MINVLSYFIALLVTVPLFATGILYYIARSSGIHPLKALHVAVHWTTIFYILSVCVIGSIIFNFNVIGIIITFLLVLITTIIVLQWRMQTEVNFARAFKIMLRISFLIFGFLYALLVLLGVIQRIFF
ncbi:MAG: DUF3397 domain-containing protein [Bacillota bacterium]|uniref:DUF3397 domain-containing protein n=1 Tax=Virgibacillus salarius TaxID=447199 RepID=A0A941DRP1_9BACI|nr:MULTISPECIES: DUF3397 domain-containing protein [Bacillaceae]NAZ08055.1 DUF3397 family protein [Agaribacter marinus]MBR7795340.1 DUF3397 domain-containing protein [Virgibacillus salarius]MCC2249614.1 DUF3397 domain-containing protein [Virgibacillus sp. AGTR]MDY7044194.1 DUF3397 domain-containing protein [Virgibacillus sp. M23]QRZ16865.1 DUF3397 domain-containing protein [Virgibacillus sp. AGTR]